MAPSGSGGTLDLATAGWFQVSGPDNDGVYRLFVGRLDGRAFEALRNSGVRAAGPHRGQVLAWWQDGAESVVSLVETDDGTSVELLRTDSIVEAAAFGPKDDWYYITRKAGAGASQAIWRRPLGEGGRERIADGWPGQFDAMVSSVDHRNIAVWTFHFDGSQSYQVLDVCSGRLEARPSPEYQDVVGLFGERIVVWKAAPTGALKFPLVAIGPDGSLEELVDGPGTGAAVYADTAGGPVLVFEGATSEDTYRVAVLRVSGAGPQTVFTSEEHWFDPMQRLVWRWMYAGIEAPGYVAIMPMARAYLEPIDVEYFRDVPRQLVSVVDGHIINLGPQQEPIRVQ